MYRHSRLNEMQTLYVPQQLQLALIARRKRLKLSQAVVASKLGLSQNRYSEIESNPASLTVDRLLSLAAILGLEVQIGLKSGTSTEGPPELPKVNW